MRISLIWVALALLAGPAAAQSAADAPRLPRADASMSVGWLHSDVSALTEGHNNWAGQRATLAGQAGVYWTEHLKTEVMAERSTGQTVWEGHNVLLNGSSAFRSSEHRIQDTRLSIGQFYQFGHNQWAHASIGAGVSVTWRHTATEVSPLMVYDRIGQRQIEPGEMRSSEETRTNAFAAAAVKAYVTPRWFVRTDTQLDFRGDLDNVVLRVGFGVDF